MLVRQRLTTEQRLDRLERRYDTLASWMRKLIAEQELKAKLWSVRPPMPTLNPDDSGSIDVSMFGTSAKFTGKVPVRAAIVAMAIIVFGVSCALIGRLIAPIHDIHTQDKLETKP